MALVESPHRARDPLYWRQRRSSAGCGGSPSRRLRAAGEPTCTSLVRFEPSHRPPSATCVTAAVSCSTRLHCCAWPCRASAAHGRLATVADVIELPSCALYLVSVMRSRPSPRCDRLVPRSRVRTLEHYFTVRGRCAPNGGVDPFTSGTRRVPATPASSAHGRVRPRGPRGSPSRAEPRRSPLDSVARPRWPIRFLQCWEHLGSAGATAARLERSPPRTGTRRHLPPRQLSAPITHARTIRSRVSTLTREPVGRVRHRPSPETVLLVSAWAPVGLRSATRASQHDAETAERLTAVDELRTGPCSPPPMTFALHSPPSRLVSGCVRYSVPARNGPSSTPSTTRPIGSITRDLRA